MHLHKPLYLLAALMVFMVGIEGRDITCNAPSVARGQPAAVTCNFNRDVSKERKQIVVEKYDFEENLPSFVLDCSWLTGVNVPLCYTEHGYDFNNDVKDSLTLDIQNATEKNVGMYVCHLLPADMEDRLETCTFTLKETTFPVLETSTVFSKKQENSDASLLPILLSVFLTLGIVVTVSVLLVRFRRRLSILGRGSQAPSLDLKGPARAEDLLQACERNDVQRVKELINDGAPVNSNNENGETPLHVACRCGSEDLLKLLLNKAADIKRTNNKGFTPLHEACKYNRKAAVKRLLANGASVNAEGEDDLTPLHVACQYGSIDVLGPLLSAGAKIEAKDIKQMRPLHLACKTGSLGLVEALINRNADVNAKCEDESTPLLVACQNCENGKEVTENVTLTIQADDGKQDGPTAQYVASQNEQETIIRILLSANAHADARDNAGMTALHWACKNGQQTFVRQLLAHGARVNVADQEGRTPLHLACETGSKEIVVSLYHHNADIRARTTENLTPENIAQQNNHTEIVSLLELFRNR